jgi:hypothetical protein
MDPLSLARYGMMTAANRLASSAQRVVEVGADAAREVVEQIEARQQFALSAKLVGISDEMWSSLLAIQTR